ncbi:MAG TPA: protein kinase [Vicinamibacterales bacterium]|nr:protein kinase [Vicinamibacterales bacterium]
MIGADSVMIGQKLGTYEIVATLGAGGMGEVYRARDTKLGREVAIKVVLEAFLADRDRLLRFEREARALAALNHPNIATLHGMEEAGGRHFLVMELVAGRTLAETLAAGPMTLGAAIDIARQIAEALEAAHEKGIVHRDLKPANVKITPDEKVKVLDFGLAKAGAEGAANDASGLSPTLANSPTLTAMGTQAGMILGTASYMSPEQARGLSGDHRSDVFSFGVVLYEMLSGRQPFQGETISDVLASVLARDPDLTALPKAIPLRLTDLVARCLDKHPKRRWQAIGDVRHELEVIAKNPDASDPVVQARTPPPPLWRRALAPLGALTLGAAATAALFTASRPTPAPPEAVAFEITAPGAGPAMSLSPDGRHVVFGTLQTDSSPSRVWIRSLASMEIRPLAGTEGALIRRASWIGNLPWSPDSRSIVFSSTGGLSRIDVISGQATNLVKSPGSAVVLIPGAWGRDGTILYGQRSAIDGRGAGIWRIAESGGAPVQVTALSSGELAHRPSGFLPDGRRFLYVAYGANLSTNDNDIRVGSIDRKPSEQDAAALFTADGPPVYAPSGHLLFVRRGSLMAQPFDAERGVLGGTPVQIASGVGSTISVSDDGRLLYRTAASDEAPFSEIVRFDRKGTVLGKIGPPARYGDVNALADGVGLAIARSVTGDAGNLYIVDPARAVFTRLNPGTVTDFAAAVAPDNLVAFTYSPEGGSKDLYVRPANGVADARALVVSPNAKHANSWTRDGRFLIYDEHVPGRSQDLLMVRREGGAPVTLLATAADETVATVSPDGKWLAYRSTDSGSPEVYVRDFYPDRTPVFGDVKIQISVAGGDKPRWSPDGHEIFFLQGEAMMAASVVPTGASLKPGIPQKLFETKYTNYIPFDVLKNGTFVVNVPAATATPSAATTLRVLLNWESLMRK